MRDDMKDPKTFLLIMATALVVVGLIIAFVVNTVRDSKIDVIPIPEEALNIGITETENNNPMDYSSLEPGVSIYDDFWQGEVTIVGKIGEVDYETLKSNAHGRLIANQDGMFIYVDRSKKTEDQQEDKINSSCDEPNVIPDDETKVGLAENDASFYASPSVNINNISLISQDAEKMFPACGWSGLRFAVRKYLIDLDMPKVTSITVNEGTKHFNSLRSGFECSLDGMDDVSVSITFNWDNGLWRFACSTKPERYTEYNPVAFIAPSARQAACDELNQLIGYERIKVSEVSAEASNAFAVEVEPTPNEKPEENQESVEK